jgi:predicted nucleotidyltransferase
VAAGSADSAAEARAAVERAVVGEAEKLTMTPEQFAEQIRQALPTGLRSVVLHGSAAAGDHLGERSDYNVLVVADQLGLPELKALTAPTAGWVKDGNRPPMLFTVASLGESGDVFPLELLDMRDANRVLFGEDLLKSVTINEADLRRQVEQELKGKRLHLQSQFLLTGAKPDRILDLMAGTISTFLVLFRAAARLYRKEVPPKKLDALRVLAQHITLDEEVFITILELKRSRRRVGDAEALFGRYLSAIDAVILAVNKLEKGTQR